MSLHIYRDRQLRCRPMSGHHSMLLTNGRPAFQFSQYRYQSEVSTIWLGMIYKPVLMQVNTCILSKRHQHIHFQRQLTASEENQLGLFLNLGPTFSAAYPTATSGPMWIAAHIVDPYRLGVIFHRRTPGRLRPSTLHDEEEAIGKGGTPMEVTAAARKLQPAQGVGLTWSINKPATWGAPVGAYSRNISKRVPSDGTHSSQTNYTNSAARHSSLPGAACWRLWNLNLIS